MTVKNASQLPRRYFGLHMEEGVAQYRHEKENGGHPYCILVQKNALDRMEKTFDAKPLYVFHVDEVNLPALEKEIAGVVAHSFLNKWDGKRWIEFTVHSDEGHDAVAKGYRLSNAYRVTESGPGGSWHAVNYVQEVMNGEYEHVALVPNPRYENSVIFTPEQFDAYNEKLKASQDTRVLNSLGDNPVFTFFTKSKVENAEAEKLAKLSLSLKSGREVTVTQLVNEADAIDAEKKKNEELAAKGEHPMCNEEHMVEVEEKGEKKKYNVKDLVSKYNDMHKAASAEPGVDGDDKDAEEKAKADKVEIESKQNALDAEKAALKAKEDALAEKTRLFNERKNAADKQVIENAAVPKIETMEDRLKRGREIA